jgi:peroxiredoxin Q/BCP
MTLTVGQPAPAFTLESSDGGTVALEDLRGSIVVLYFYPRDSTPGCTIEAEEFRDALPELKALGAIVLGASKDSIKSHCKFRDKYALTFPLLSDPDGATLSQYGAWGEKVMYGKPMTGIIRSTVIIDRDGTVARTFPKVSAKGHAAQVVAAVRNCRVRQDAHRRDAFCLASRSACQNKRDFPCPRG